MVEEREVVVTGDIVTIWNTLHNTLAYNNYTIKSMIPHTTIVTERGSQLVSGFVGGTKEGYRKIDITMEPSGQNILVKFKIKFSAWGLGISYKGSVYEIDEMIKSFQNQCVTLQQEYPCTTCGRLLRFIPEYQRWFCDNCRKYP